MAVKKNAKNVSDGSSSPLSSLASDELVDPEQGTATEMTNGKAPKHGNEDCIAKADECADNAVSNKTDENDNNGTANDVDELALSPVLAKESTPAAEEVKQPASTSSPQPQVFDLEDTPSPLNSPVEEEVLAPLLPPVGNKESTPFPSVPATEKTSTPVPQSSTDESFVPVSAPVVKETSDPPSSASAEKALAHDAPPSFQEPNVSTSHSPKAKVEKKGAALEPIRTRPVRASAKRNASEVLGVPSSPAKKSRETSPPPPAKAPPVKPKPEIRGAFNPTRLLTSSASRLTRCDLNALLRHPRAWTSLSAAQQNHLLSFLPDPMLSVTSPRRRAFGLEDDERVTPAEMLVGNPAFQADVRFFQDDLLDGHYHPSWLTRAQAAFEDRKSGKFDDWKFNEREEYWGQKTEFEPLADPVDQKKGKEVDDKDV